MKGIVLFAHGARDARWAEPFERVLERVEAQRPDVPVALAFLELMTPDLDAAVDALVARGCTRIAIVPLFLGQGSHLRRDLPERVAAIRARRPDVDLVVTTAAGDDDAVVSALVDHGVRAFDAI